MSLKVKQLKEKISFLNGINKKKWRKKTIKHITIIYEHKIVSAYTSKNILFISTNDVWTKKDRIIGKTVTDTVLAKVIYSNLQNWI